MGRKGKKRNRENRNVAAAVTIAVICFILCGTGIGMWIYYSQAGNMEIETAGGVEIPADTYDTIREDMPESSEDPMRRQIDFNILKERNQDVYAWIWIPGTNIDYPVLQSRQQSDDYYLNTTIDGEKGYPGSIYTEKYNAESFTDPVTVMYGHNMKDGTMFTQLHKYTDREFFEQYPYIYIYQPDQTIKYQIFAAVAFDDRYILGNYNFSDPDDFQKYLDELCGAREGNVNDKITATEDSKILTLSTCISESPDERWLVNGTIVEKVENP